MRHRSGKLAVRALYWVVVVAISLALVVALVLFLESRDRSSVKDAVVPVLRLS
jgi:hypothetical protein